jgi:hypothetical protein
MLNDFLLDIMTDRDEVYFWSTVEWTKFSYMHCISSVVVEKTKSHWTKLGLNRVGSWSNEDASGMHLGWIRDESERGSRRIREGFKIHSRPTRKWPYLKHTWSILGACLNHGKTMIESCQNLHSIGIIFQQYSNRSSIFLDCLRWEKSFNWPRWGFGCDVVIIFNMSSKDVRKMLEPCSNNVRTGREVVGDKQTMLATPDCLIGGNTG